MNIQRLSTADVATHDKPTDIYIIIDENVYDLTEFQEDHPGGKKILSRVAGKDASKQFWKYHNESILRKYKKQLLVGVLDSKENKELEPTTESHEVVPIPQENVPVEVQSEEIAESLEPFGNMIPFADPSWYHGFYSPYYNVSHAALREELREWVTHKLEPFVEEWENAGKVPEEVYKEMGTRGYLTGCVGSLNCSQYADYSIASVPFSKWDRFHELVLTDELSRAGSGGVLWNIVGGIGIGCPPVAMFASEELKQKVLPGILNGDKRICLAITEPDAGSDVANINCEAKLSEDGSHYIVNGEKKWITNGLWCDYMTTAVRTGTKESGMNGISVLLIEREFAGVKTRKMECQGVLSSGTAFVSFEDVKVPVGNLIGMENEGFKVIMSNFNHERMGIIVQCLRFSRICYEEAVKYAYKRRTFGKPLIKHPVIRLKLAHMIRQIEASHAWLENIVAQSSVLPNYIATLRLGGPIASLKAQCTITFEFCAREASQIFGGLSYSRGGQGGKVERLYRDVRAYAIPGGSEEIMLDLSVRQSLKVAEMTGMKL
ncbi:Acyl-CoA dehydrogenase apdG [Erysiphe neolycopersici]|uniref:Acyl-CoA dehydrogenase apdG n=1 Tax=Erysiphe neolycopersici TaxID=212602 RepID=A0A420HR73_9PEZI|nr:Acyl-CoA dehydrogenase apdG [Erysiphe neolycopersici]